MLGPHLRSVPHVREANVGKFRLPPPQFQIENTTSMIWVVLYSPATLLPLPIRTDDLRF
jgi:hypothetical protein